MSSKTGSIRLVTSIAFLVALGLVTQAHAQLGIGTWVRTDARGKGITVTVESC